MWPTESWKQFNSISTCYSIQESKFSTECNLHRIYTNSSLVDFVHRDLLQCFCRSLREYIMCWYMKQSSWLINELNETMNNIPLAMTVCDPFFRNLHTTEHSLLFIPSFFCEFLCSHLNKSLLISAVRRPNSPATNIMEKNTVISFLLKNMILLNVFNFQVFAFKIVNGTSLKVLVRWQN